MRVLLIIHEGEQDYCTLSDDTRNCEVTAFIGIKVCLIINCIRKAKRGLCLSDRPTKAKRDPALLCSEPLHCESLMPGDILSSLHAVNIHVCHCVHLLPQNN